MPKKYDFSGYVTKFNVRCADGRIIRNKAFMDDDGKTVPLVWQHDHDNPENVLGHILLENRNDGVFGYGTFNSTKRARHAKAALDNDDYNSMSIYANKLQENKATGDVYHGSIKEVSLVLSGANPEAVITTKTIMHSDEIEYVDDEAEIYIPDEEGIVMKHHNKYDDELDELEEELDEEDEEYEEDDEDELEEIEDEYDDDEEFEDEDEEEYEEYDEDEEEDDIEHSDDEDDDNLDYSKVYKTLNKEQKMLFKVAVNYILEDGEVSHSDMPFEEDDEDDDDPGRTLNDVFATLDDNQRDLFFKVLAYAKTTEISHSDDEEGEDDMYKNVFDEEVMEQEDDSVITHDEEVALIEGAKRAGSMRDYILANANTDAIMHSGDVEYGPQGIPGEDYGVQNIEYLYPDARAMNNVPFFYNRPDEWVAKVLAGTSKSPMSRLKSLWADITEDEARAKGYIKGTRKINEIFPVLKRTTSPCTIYKHQTLDRDDIIDIKDFDSVAWLKNEMRIKLDEERARAILIGDGRDTMDQYKIDETKIRPIWTDDELFTINYTIDKATVATADVLAKAVIRAAVKSRKEYRGSGKPTAFMSEDLLTEMLLLEDRNGRIIYDTVEKLKTAMRVDEIVTVPYFDNLTREVTEEDHTNTTRTLQVMIVNLKDYTEGTDKGGEVSLFDDFDIDFNQMKYLIETRRSGSLMRPKSAIVIEVTEAAVSS